jgi:hypothetical protein
MANFSERNNLKQRIVDPQEMPEGLKKRIWNSVERKVNESRHRNNLIEKIWCDFLKQSRSELKGITSYK